MEKFKELEDKINKLESKSKYRFYVEVVIIPLMSILILWWVNYSLNENEYKWSALIQENELMQQRYELNSSLIAMILDTLDSKKSYLTFHLINKVDPEFASDVKPTLINWKIDKIINCIERRKPEIATHELNIAYYMGGMIGYEIHNTFQKDTSRRIKVAREQLVLLAKEATEESSESGGSSPSDMKKNVQLALDTDKAVKSTASQGLVDEIMSSNVVTKTPSKSLKQASLSSKREGWMFLGTFDRSSNKWVTNYLNGITSLMPTQLEGKSFRILNGSSSNIRQGKPTEYAEFLPVKMVLKSGETVRILTVEPWSSSDYYWANVEY